MQTIMPVNISQTVNCIFVEGVRYCEKEQISSEEIGVMSIAILITIFWIFLTILTLTKSIDGELPSWVPASIFLFPFIIGSFFIFF